ncbi:MAG TPA: fatty acid desaturase family protein [Candidatus Kryptonia bacterium]|nr:fatty acid desaturase family protein [Candidatus Kryptonia bacterium]
MTSTPAPANWLDALSRAEIDALLERRDARAWLSIAINWGLTFAAFGLVAWAPNPLTIVIALFVIGARQLGGAIMMHEAAHRALFNNRELNDWVGNWLCAFPVWGDLRPYRAYHLQHHAKTGTTEDPDLGLAAPFPVTRASLRRKVWRDLSGRTGWKRAKATLKRDLGISRGRVARKRGAGISALHGVVITNFVLLLILTLLGHPALYLLWVVAWLTTYSLAMRIRSIAEHGMVPDNGDELRNTRTTLASWWERLLIAPNRVNYHLEHHLLMTVPLYNLPRLHRMLRDRGVLQRACVTRGYLEVLRLAASRPETAASPVHDASLAERPPF